MDPEFGRSLSKAEGVRLRADYTGAELDPATAREAISDAERSVQSVEQAFGLHSVSTEVAPGKNSFPSQKAASPKEDDSLRDKSESMEERRRQGVQDWLEYRKKEKEAARIATRERETAGNRDRSRTPDRGHDPGDDDPGIG